MYVFFDMEMSNLDANFGQVLCAVVKTERGDTNIVRFDNQVAHLNGFNSLYTDRETVLAIRSLLESFVGDIWVSYNGKKFDIPFLDTRLLIHGERPVTQGMHLDPLYIARYKLRLNNNRLDTVAKALGVDSSKTAIEPGYWIPALRGDRASMDYVVDHCVRDVAVLEEVFNKLRPFVDKVAKRGMS